MAKKLEQRTRAPFRRWVPANEAEPISMPAKLAPVGHGSSQKWDTVIASPLPEASVQKPCRPPAKMSADTRAMFEETGEVPAGKSKPRDCHVELVIVGPKQAAAKRGPGVAPGIYVRACQRFGDPAPLIQVRSSQESIEVSRSICACVETSKRRGKKKTARDCAEQLYGKSNPLGGSKAGGSGMNGFGW